jgi:nicotinamide-nucleotide amidase
VTTSPETTEDRGDRPTIDDLAARAAAGLRASAATLAVAESLTGGMVVSHLARTEGASDWLRGGIVAYASSVKHGLLEVRDGPVVSRGAAHDLAVNVARLLDATVGLSITGVGGPDPQDGIEPGTVWIGVSVAGEPCDPTCHRFEGSPTEVCEASTNAALGRLLEALGGDDTGRRAVGAEASV